MKLREKVKAIKQHVEQLNSLIKEEEKRHPTRPSLRRADLFHQEFELEYYSKLLRERESE